MALVALVVSLVRLTISVLQMFMIARAILSWLPFDDSSPLLNFVYMVTEPIILPVRKVLERIDFFANLPIDLSFLVAYLLLIFVMYLLPAVNF